MDITLLCPMLSGNALGRAFVLARVLERRHRVRIVGPVWEKGIWHPLRQECLDCVAVKMSPGRRSFSALRPLLDHATGDVIYASKPLWPSLGVGLLRKAWSGTPLVLDIDDWELGGYLEHSLRWRIRDSLQPRGYTAFLWLMYKLVKYADAITVSSRFLQERYGGVLVPHGRETQTFDPARYDPAHLKEQHDLAGKQVVMFLGTLRPRKGIEELIEAVEMLDRPDVVLALVGVDKDSPFSEKVKQLAHGRVRLFGMQPFAEIPRFWAMADVAVFPQRLDQFTRAQVPAKLYDAMAMAKPIVATAVSDIPEILGDGLGILVQPENVEQIADGIRWVLENEAQAGEMGRRAREKCVREYSWDAIESTLCSVVEQFA